MIGDSRWRGGGAVEATVRLDADTRSGLELAARFLHARVAALRAAGVPVGEDDYRGLYIPEREVDRLLDQPPGARVRDSEPVDGTEIGQLRDELEQLVGAASGRLGRLIATGPFSAAETGGILLCLAAETDPNIERLLAYAQDDVSRRRPRVGFLVDMFGRDRFAGRDAWLPKAPLRATRVVKLVDEGGGSLPLAARTVTLDPRIAEYLLGSDAFTEPLAGNAELICPRDDAAQLLPVETVDQARRVATFPNPEPPTVVALCGNDEGLSQKAAELVAQFSGRELLRVSMPGLAADVGLEAAVALSVREAELRDAVLLLADAAGLGAAETAKLTSALESERTARQPLLVALPEGAGWPGTRLDIPEAGFETRRGLWANASGAETGGDDGGDALDAVAGRFRLGVDAIGRAGSVARRKAEWAGVSKSPTREDLFDAARGQSTPILSGLAQKVTSRFTWDDLVLPSDGVEQLKEIAARVEYQHRVLETWGFEKKLDLGRGTIALFAGNSGTGKTMAAGVMANSLALDLYRVDLSSIVSKYIGETEKNLDAIFREAERSNAILFFDEADALFGKRSEVKDAHDRYANIETAYLLQRMEEYSGVVILATNLKMNLDEAFLRRLHFAVDFPMPNEAHRRLIWQKAFPPEAPLAGDIDWDFLGRQFKISGGNIKNSVIAAAFFAAAEDESIGMGHLVRGIRREYQKLGRMVTAAEFGGYAALVNNAE